MYRSTDKSLRVYLNRGNIAPADDAPRMKGETWCLKHKPSRQDLFLWGVPVNT